MAANSQDPTVKLPPLENWAAQTFAYGFLLDRSAALDYSGNAAPNQSGRSGFDKPQPDDLHLLNLNPQSLSMSEPIATSVTPSQGGGKFVESRGGVMKTLSIRGTTGFMPPVSPYAQHMKGPQIVDTKQSSALDAALSQQQNQTGFFEFYRLRRLFRQFMLERRQGKAVQMHWLDFKGDEFWMCEPMRFDLERGRFTYTYNIQCDLIEPSQLNLKHSNQGQDAKIRGLDPRDFGKVMLANPLHGALDPQQLNLLSRLGRMADSATTFLKNYALGVITLKWQRVLSDFGAIQSFFSDISAVRRAAIDTPLNLYKQLNSSMQGLGDAFEAASSDAQAFKNDINEWYIEAKTIVEGLMSNHVAKFGSNVGRMFSDENSKYTTPRAVGGTKNAFITETVNSQAVTQTGGGLALIGNVEQMVATTALRGEDVLTGETIFDVAQRLLGDAQRFIDLIIVNRLKPPFIVSSMTDKLPGTIAWGEKILVPAQEESASLSTAAPVETTVPTFSGAVVTSIDFSNFTITTPQIPYRDDMWLGFTVTWLTGNNAGQSRMITANTDLGTETQFTLNRSMSNAIAIGDTFNVSLVLFSSRLPVTPENAAFGTDIMGAFTKMNGVMVDGTVDIMLNAGKDLATISGIENFEQAITLALQTPRGSNKSNPLYGTSSVVGRPMDPNITALNVFYVRQSLLQDPRVASVERPSVQYIGGSLFFTVYVRPVRVQRTLLLRIPL